MIITLELKSLLEVIYFDTPLVYRSCDILGKLSYVEGMFGPPLEMFHCGWTAIVYNVTGMMNIYDIRRMHLS
jgi:hypothetical protein